MEENALKTSWKQRLIIAAVAALLLGSSVAVYVAIVLGGDNVNYSRMTTSQLETAYEKAYSDYEARAAELSNKYFDEFKSYKSSVKRITPRLQTATALFRPTLKKATATLSKPENIPPITSAIVPTNPSSIQVSTPMTNRPRLKLRFLSMQTRLSKVGISVPKV